MTDLLHKSVINWFASTLVLPFSKEWHGVTPLLCTCNNIKDLNTLLGHINIPLLMTKRGSFIYCKLDQIVLNRCKMAFVKGAFHWWGVICSWKQERNFISLCFFCAKSQTATSRNLKTPAWQAQHIQGDMKQQTDVCGLKTLSSLNKLKIYSFAICDWMNTTWIFASLHADW